MSLLESIAPCQLAVVSSVQPFLLSDRENNGAARMCNRTQLTHRRISKTDSFNPLDWKFGKQQDVDAKLIAYVSPTHGYDTKIEYDCTSGSNLKEIGDRVHAGFDLWKWATSSQLCRPRGQFLEVRMCLLTLELPPPGVSSRVEMAGR
nr:hypothetical protein CFP56_21311 [Quercus suber]